MPAIANLQARLKRCPGLGVWANASRLVVTPEAPGSFQIDFWERGDGITVYFGTGWHCDFEDEEAAVACFWLGLSPDCRLRTYSWGPIPYRATVETLEDGQWRPSPRVPYHTTASILGVLGLVLWPWRRVTESRNEVLPAA